MYDEIKQIDIANIEAGNSGMGDYREARTVTNNIALIEGGEFGTTCARVGCMPSKLLITPAEARRYTKQFKQFGLNVGTPEVMGIVLMNRVKQSRSSRKLSQERHL